MVEVYEEVLALNQGKLCNTRKPGRIIRMYEELVTSLAVAAVAWDGIKVVCAERSRCSRCK